MYTYIYIISPLGSLVLSPPPTLISLSAALGRRSRATLDVHK